MKILTASQMQQIDRLTTSELSIPSLTLMENAGFSVYSALSERFEEPGDQDVAIVCGKGNNGGDGMVLARQLAQRGLVPDIFILAKVEEVVGDAAVNLKIVLNWGIPVFEVTSESVWNDVSQNLEVYDVIVDAILGTGITKPLESLYSKVVEDINQTDAFVLSVDIPSGMFSDSLIRSSQSIWADATVTFTAPKIAHVLSPDIAALGELTIAPIGTPPEMLEKPEYFLNLLTLQEVASRSYPRAPDSHKGTFGHIALIAGSQGKSGAAALGTKAALRAGSGLVTALVPDVVQNLVSSFSPEVMTEGLPSVGGSISRSAVEQTLSILQGKNAAGMGPGLTTHDECVEFVKGIVRQSPVGLVLDADALNAFEGDVEEIQNQNDRPIVLTPHPGEFSRLTGVRTSALLENQIEITRDFCFQHRVWVVLKTFRPLIGTPSGDLYVSPCGNPGMATAGMGDVLTGIITSLLGQFCAQDLDKKEDVTSAVLIAVYLHGLAGDLALERLGPESLIAGDVSDAVSEAYREIWEARGK